MKNTVTDCCIGHLFDPFRSFAHRCTKLAKEQRARFYIFRKCVAMLVCWQDSAADDDL